MSVRRMALWVTATSLAMSGLSYAGTGAPNPVKSAIDAVTTSDVTGTPDPTASPTPSPTVAPKPTPEPKPSPEPAAKTSSKSSPKPRSTEGCPPGFTGNHGQFVSSTDERPRSEAAHSPCGKPVKPAKAQGRP